MSDRAALLIIFISILVGGVLFGGYKYGHYQAKRGEEKILRELDSKEGNINAQMREAYTLGCQQAAYEVLYAYGVENASSIAQEAREGCMSDADSSLSWYSLN